MARCDIYTRMMCGYCSAAKRLLEEKGVSYAEHDATLSPELRQQMIQRVERPHRPFRRYSSATSMSAAATTFMRSTSQGRLDGLLKTGQIELRQTKRGI